MGLAATILQAQFKQAHDWLKGTLSEAITKEQVHYQPEGKPTPIGAQFIHVVTTEDFLINFAQGADPLMATDYAGKIGVSEMPPQGDWTEWSKSVEIDIAQTLAYADAVFAATEAFVGVLDDATLESEMDLSAVGFGKMPTHAALGLLLLNVYSHAGEISVIKGLQGLKGYPM